jgi:hypothetical protein
MTFTDYLLIGTLIALVLLQIRGRRISAHTLALPIVIVAFAAVEYLHGVPTSGDNLVLVLAGALTGLALGIGCGLATAVYRNSDELARSGGGYGIDGTRERVRLLGAEGGGLRPPPRARHLKPTGTRAPRSVAA